MPFAAVTAEGGEPQGFEAQKSRAALPARRKTFMPEQY
jgi:hypothetical protein